jgi:hypothetical protein
VQSARPDVTSQISGRDTVLIGRAGYEPGRVRRYTAIAGCRRLAKEQGSSINLARNRPIKPTSLPFHPSKFKAETIHGVPYSVV